MGRPSKQKRCGQKVGTFRCSEVVHGREKLAEVGSDARLGRRSWTGSGPTFGEHYGAQRTRRRQELLGLRERAAISTRCPDWVRRHASRLSTCLPASGPDLDELLAQLKVTGPVESADELT